MNILSFAQKKLAQQKISLVTCYDAWSAKLINQSPIDCILVGDSAAMVMHGHATTVPMTLDIMVWHTAAVARAATHKFIVGDLPFCSYRTGKFAAVKAAQQLMQAGAHAVKLEGAEGNLDVVRHLVHSGIPVMGHLGLTPQAFHTLGGFKVQAREQQQAELLKQQALALQDAGCFALVLECIPSTLAKDVTDLLSIPTIGIGAGPDTDGQVLVLHDLLGLDPHFKPKFCKRYLDGHTLISAALTAYHDEVTAKHFPKVPEHSFQ